MISRRTSSVATALAVFAILWATAPAAGAAATFSGLAEVPAGTNPWSVAVGDFNGDARADLAVVNLSSDNLSVRLGVGNGTFTAAADVAVGDAPWSVAVGDFNGDTKADLAVANQNANNVS